MSRVVQFGHFCLFFCMTDVSARTMCPGFILGIAHIRISFLLRLTANTAVSVDGIPLRPPSVDGTKVASTFRLLRTWA